MDVRMTPPNSNAGTALQYAVDNKCPGWEKYAKKYAEHLR